MVIAERNFRDEELFQPRQILEKAGIGVSVASVSLKTATGMLGGTCKPDLLLSSVKAEDYNAVVFIGGEGAQQYWKDPAAHGLARDFLKAGKVVAAICIGPMILANAGILKGKKATVWESESTCLKRSGATYTAQRVEKDGKIITAAGPFAAAEFGQAILAAIRAGNNENRGPGGKSHDESNP